MEVTGRREARDLKEERSFFFARSIRKVEVKYNELLMRNSGQTEGGLEANNAAFLEDVAQNADLYIANQGGSMQI